MRGMSVIELITHLWSYRLALDCLAADFKDCPLELEEIPSAPSTCTSRHLAVVRKKGCLLCRTQNHRCISQHCQSLINWFAKNSSLFFCFVLVFRKTRGVNICHLLYFPGSWIAEALFWKSSKKTVVSSSGYLWVCVVVCGGCSFPSCYSETQMWLWWGSGFRVWGWWSSKLSIWERVSLGVRTSHMEVVSD